MLLSLVSCHKREFNVQTNSWKKLTPTRFTGIPFTDPLADGPTIQYSSTVSKKASHVDSFRLIPFILTFSYVRFALP
jgi:hypothetical protein